MRNLVGRICYLNLLGFFSETDEHGRCSGNSQEQLHKDQGTVIYGNISKVT